MMIIVFLDYMGMRTYTLQFMTMVKSLKTLSLALIYCFNIIEGPRAIVG